MPSHYVVIPFDTEKEANEFAFNLKTHQCEVVDHHTYNQGKYSDIESFMNEYMGLSYEQACKVDLRAVSDEIALHCNDDMDYLKLVTVMESAIRKQL